MVEPSNKKNIRGEVTSKKEVTPFGWFYTGNKRKQAILRVLDLKKKLIDLGYFRKCCLVPATAANPNKQR